MNIDIHKSEELELGEFKTDLERIENQTLDLIYDPLLDCVCTRAEWLSRKGLIPWKCAICGCDIMTDTSRDDVENFVCERCKVAHNNSNQMIDKRIVISRTNMYKHIEDCCYDELEDMIGYKK